MQPALVAYDYLLTLSREIELVWKSQFRLSALLYLVARYPVLVIRILSCVTAELNPTPQVIVFILRHL